MLAQVLVVISLLGVSGAIKVLSTDSSQLLPNWTGQAEILNCSLENYQQFREVVALSDTGFGVFQTLFSMNDEF